MAPRSSLVNLNETLAKPQQLYLANYPFIKVFPCNCNDMYF